MCLIAIQFLQWVLKILSSQKRGWSRGTNRFASTSSIGVVFLGAIKGLVSCLKSQKTVKAFKKIEYFLTWSALPKTQRPTVSLRYSPCDHSPTAATIDLTKGGVSLLISKNILLCFHTPPYGTWPYRYYGRGSGSIVAWVVA